MVPENKWEKFPEKWEAIPEINGKTSLKMIRTLSNDLRGSTSTQPQGGVNGGVSGGVHRSEKQGEKKGEKKGRRKGEMKTLQIIHATSILSTTT